MPNAFDIANIVGGVISIAAQTVVIVAAEKIEEILKKDIPLHPPVERVSDDDRKIFVVVLFWD